MSLSEKAAKTRDVIEAGKTDSSAGHDNHRLAKWLNLLTVAAGFAQFWTGRFQVSPDGISYLDIAHNYAAGNWHMAVNAYWSPLLSWALAAIFFIGKTTRENDAVLLHTLNLVAFVCSVTVFDRLLRHVADTVVWKTEFARDTYTLTGYSAFCWAALFAVPIWRSTPDPMVLTVFLALCLTLSIINTGTPHPRHFLVVGILLGVGYLLKAVVLTIAPFVIAAALYSHRARRVLKFNLIYACALLFVIVLVWVVMLRVAIGSWTVGETGKLNYAFDICGVEPYVHWQGGSRVNGIPLHPTRLVLKQPAIFEFAGPIADVSTYAPWYSPAWWYAGLTLSVSSCLPNLGGAILGNAKEFIWLLLFTPGMLTGIFALRRRSFGKQKSTIPIAIPAAATIAVYLFFHIESRFLGGPLLVLSIAVAAAGLSDIRSRAVLNCVRAGVIMQAVLFVGFLSHAPPNQFRDIANAARGAGLLPGDRIGYVGAAIGEYWLSLAQLHVIVEIPVRYRLDRKGLIGQRELVDTSEVDTFWRANENTKQNVLKLMREAGARAVVTDTVPPHADLHGWRQLAPFSVYLRFLE